MLTGSEDTWNKYTSPCCGPCLFLTSLLLPGLLVSERSRATFGYSGIHDCLQDRQSTRR
jgi:hypothetical protein